MVFETILQSDLQKMVNVKQLTGNLFSADNGGNKITVEILDGGAPATVSGSVYGYAIREDEKTVVIEGTLSGNKASIVLPASAYAVIGKLNIVVKVGTITVGACSAYVYRTTTDAIVDPGSVVPDISELLAQIGACEEATTAANTAASAANSAAANVGNLIAPAYANLTFPISKGQPCIYNNVRYQANQDIATSENWTASHWSVMPNVSDESSALKSAINRIDYTGDNQVCVLVFTQGGYYKDTDNSFVNDATWGYTDLIPCVAGKKYYLNLPANQYVCFYDSSKAFLQGYIAKEVTAPTNAAYIRLSIKNTRQETVRLTVDGEYKDYVEELQGNLSETKAIEKIYTKSDYTIIGYIRQANGNVETVSGFHRTDYIDIGEKPVRIKGYGKNVNNILAIVAFYDSSKNFINAFYGINSIYDAATFDILSPSNARYIIASTVDEIDSFIEISEYSGFGYTIGKYINSSGTLSSEYGFLTSDFIEISPSDLNKPLIVNASARSVIRQIYFYDANQSPIIGVSQTSGGLTEISSVVPINAAYYRMCGLWPDSGKFYGRYGEQNLKDMPITKRTVSASDYKNEGYIKSGGSIDSASGFHYTDYIPVDKTYQKNVVIGHGSSVNNILALVAFYDSEKNFIGSYTGNYTSGTHVEKYKFALPFGTEYIRLSAVDTELSNIDCTIYFLNDEKRVIRVGSGYGCEYSSLTDAFKFTETEPRHCVIHVEAGEYDIFDELGGETFITSIPSGATAYTIDMPWLYDVDVIGHGKVKLVYSPDESFASLHYTENGLISPLNIRGNTKICNIEIDAKYCRYAIHDETGSSIIYNNTYREYENVIATMGAPYSAYGNTVGCGMKSGQNAVWKNCKLINTEASCAYACHSTPNGYGGSIKLENCVFKTQTKSPVKLGNWGSTSEETVVFINNCYFNRQSGTGDIRLAIESSGVSSSNSFMVYALNNNSAIITVDDGLPNEYTPEVLP